MKFETAAIHAGTAAYLAVLVALFLVFGLVQLCFSLGIWAAYVLGAGFAAIRRFGASLSSAHRSAGTSACGLDG